MQQFVIDIFFIGVAIALVDYFLLDDREADWRAFLHNAVYFLAAIWCGYWSISLAQEIGHTPNILHAGFVDVTEIAVVAISLFVLHTKVWTEQERKQKVIQSRIQTPPPPKIEPPPPKPSPPYGSVRAGRKIR